jgi:hypothetical protein
VVVAVRAVAAGRSFVDAVPVSPWSVRSSAPVDPRCFPLWASVCSASSGAEVAALAPRVRSAIRWLHSVVWVEAGFVPGDSSLSGPFAAPLAASALGAECVRRGRFGAARVCFALSLASALAIVGISPSELAPCFGAVVGGRPAPSPVKVHTSTRQSVIAVAEVEDHDPWVPPAREDPKVSARDEERSIGRREEDRRPASSKQLLLLAHLCELDGAHADPELLTRLTRGEARAAISALKDAEVHDRPFGTGDGDLSMAERGGDEYLDEESRQAACA